MNRLLKLLFSLLFIGCCWTGNAAEIWVATNGSDNNIGTANQPLATVAAAFRMAREMRRLHNSSIINGIHIIIKGGTYQFYEPLFVRPEDSGTPISPTIIESAPNEQAIFSGGTNITGWQKLKENITGLPKEAKGKIWVADVPMMGNNLFNFRQLWVNGAKATRAKDSDGDSMNRILSWNHEAEQCWIPKPKTADLTSIIGMEMFIHQWWAIAVLRIKSVDVQGDSAKLSFYQPESKIQSQHPWPAPWLSKETGNSAFYLTNAIQFLNQPGEWYLDVKSQKLYYYPKADEDMATSTVIAPSLETLVRVEGTIDNPVTNVFFKGISFQHTGWLRPSQMGHVPLQAGMYLLDAYKLKIPGTLDKKGLENQAWIGRPISAVTLAYTANTGFKNCQFEHLASTGLDYVKGSQKDEIIGNLFKDIGGTGIQVGIYSEEAFETHLPYNPTDKRELCNNTHIANNLVTNVANEDWGCVGISAGYVQGINIEHNEISDVSYSGICVGWGWTKTINAMRNNKMFANKVTRYAKHMYDVGGLYTLSAQPGSVISENYIDSIYKAPYAHDPKHWFYFYLDEGSSYINIKNNWCPADKVMRNSNGPGNNWENNGPMVADSIKNSAGLQLSYQYLLKQKMAYNNWPINHP
ncbi:MAG: right-handed parallel beta-helix repeat-containing protein [Pedobacter sp.]|nr:right-handed parallel beta-helix repeat-containing protein [Chitinophagaceae bacterium]